MKERTGLSFDFSDYVDMVSHHHEEAARMAARLSVIPGYLGRSERMRHCETYTKGLYCPKCKTFHTIASSLCRDRLCPNCGWALSRRRASAVVMALDNLSSVEDIEVIHVVLTLRHDSDTVLKDQIASLLQGFSRFLKKSRIRKHLIGALRSVEIKRSGDWFHDWFHPHIHALLVMDHGYNRDFIAQSEFVSMWREAARVDYDPIVWVKKAYSKNANASSIHEAIYECVKYTVKCSEWFSMDNDSLRMAADAIHGRTLFKVSGSRFVAAYMEAMERLRVDAFDGSVTPCKKCGSNRFIASINL